MGSARREIKIVAGIALLAVSVAVAAAVFLSLNLTGQVDEQRTAARELRAQVATLNEKVDAVEDHSKDLDQANSSLKSGYKQCQKALGLAQDLMIAILEASLEPTEAAFQKAEDIGPKVDKAANLCLATRVDLVDTY